MHLEHERRVVSSDRVGVVLPAAPGSSSRPRAAVAPTDSSSSGIRKPSPISTISPRATTTSRPARERAGDQGERGRAVVDHVHAAGRRAPRPRGRPGLPRPRRSAPPRVQVELDVGGAGGHRAGRPPRRRTAARGRGWCARRPRGVDHRTQRGGRPRAVRRGRAATTPSGATSPAGTGRGPSVAARLTSRSPSRAAAARPVAGRPARGRCAGVVRRASGCRSTPVLPARERDGGP